MRFLSKLWVPAALLAFASINASASTCVSLADHSLSNYQSAGSCSIGNLTFSNFQFAYTPTGGATVPSASSSTFLTVTSFADGTCDNNGACSASDGSATLYELVTDFSSDGNTTGSASVQANQSETLAIQFIVTENSGSHFISEIDGEGTGGVNSTNTGAAANYEKDICYGQGFHVSAVNGQCANNTSPNSQPVSVQMDTNPGSQTADPTQFSNMDPESGGALYSLGTLGSTFGVYDLTTLSGGTQSAGGAALAATGAQENDFLESVSTPEPGAFVLLGGALVGLGALRRRKKTA